MSYFYLTTIFVAIGSPSITPDSRTHTRLSTQRTIVRGIPVTQQLNLGTFTLRPAKFVRNYDHKDLANSYVKLMKDYETCGKVVSGYQPKQTRKTKQKKLINASD